jgi:hypothetical protein
MRALLGVGLLALAACHSATTQYVMRVDRTYDRSVQPETPAAELGADRYRAETPADRWEVALDGPKVTLSAIGEHPSSVKRLEGKETSNAGGERRFDLDGFAGGRFVLKGDDAELTMFGSGVPIVSSERGKLVPR